MKLVLVFLACALLFEFSVSIYPKRCGVKNGTFICERDNSTIISKPKCPVGYRLFCYKKTSGENKCSCIHNLKIFKPTNRTNQCPEGTSIKCSRTMRGCIFISECSCIINSELTPLSNLTKIKKKEKNLLD